MEKETIEHYIVESLKELVKRDSDIFKQKIPKLGNSTEKERKLNRDLHETTLNHRFAFYIEKKNEEIMRLKQIQKALYQKLKII